MSFADDMIDSHLDRLLDTPHDNGDDIDPTGYITEDGLCSSCGEKLANLAEKTEARIAELELANASLVGQIGWYVKEVDRLGNLVAHTRMQQIKQEIDTLTGAGGEVGSDG